MTDYYIELPAQSGGGSSGVSSINSETGAITIAGSGSTTVTNFGTAFTISSTNSGGTVTSASVVSANGLSGTVATATTTPAITLSTTVNSPVLAGNGTAISAATTTGSGSTVVLATSPTLVTPALGTPSALVGTNITGTAAGLTAGHVTTNANLTGDVTSSGNATTLATVNSNVGSFGAVDTVGAFTVNGKGLITAASSATIQIAESQVTNLVTDLAGKQPVFTPSTGSQFFEDFLGNTSSPPNITGQNSGGAITANTTLLDGDHPGILALSTGSSTSSFPSLIFGLSKSFKLGGGALHLETLIQLNQLSNGTDTYTLFFGLSDSITPSDPPSNGVWFNYTSGANSGNWVLSSIDGVTQANTNAASGPSANAWLKLAIDINAAATLATYSVNGSSVGTVSTHITTANPMSFALTIIKSAGSTPCVCYVDYFWLTQTFTTPR